MKAKITKTDGTIIELEGTPEEVAKAIGLSPITVQYIPYPYPQYIPLGPVSPWYTITCRNDNIIIDNSLFLTANN